MQKKQERLFRVAIAGIICFLLLGVCLILTTYRDYREQFIQQQESQKLQLAQAVDRNIESLLKQSRNSLEYIIGLEQFQIEEKQWLHSGITTDDMGRCGKLHVYAGGDAVTGAATVILAMGAGKKAAAAIVADHPAE